MGAQLAHLALGRGGDRPQLRRVAHQGVFELALVLIVFALCCRAALEALPDGGGGMREWRQ